MKVNVVNKETVMDTLMPHADLFSQASVPMAVLTADDSQLILVGSLASK